MRKFHSFYQQKSKCFYLCSGRSRSSEKWGWAQSSRPCDKGGRGAVRCRSHKKIFFGLFSVLSLSSRFCWEQKYVHECLVIKIFKSLLLFTSQSFPLKLVSSASACHMKQRLWLKFPFPLKHGHLIPSPQHPPPEDYGYQIPPPPPLGMAKVSSPVA